MATKVVEHYDSDSSSGLIIGFVILAVIVFLFMFFGRGMFEGIGTESSGGEGGDVNIEVPSRVDINTNPNNY